MHVVKGNFSPKDVLGQIDLGTMYEKWVRGEWVNLAIILSPSVVRIKLKFLLVKPCMQLNMPSQLQALFQCCFEEVSVLMQVNVKP